MAKLTYRAWSIDDQPALERLFAEHTTWGALTAEIWRDFIVDAPLGPPFGGVAIDTASGDIVGQIAFLPKRVRVDDIQVLAFRPQAPILSSRIGSTLSLLSPFDHPVFRMWQEAMTSAKDAGGKLLYMLPDPRWGRFLRMFPGFQTAKLPLYSLPLPTDAPSLDDGFVASPVTAWDGRLDELWARTASNIAVGEVRNAAGLRWKVGRGDWEALQVESEGRIVGLVASRQKGDRQWLIGDVVVENLDRALRNTLAAAIALSDKRSRDADETHPIRKVAILTTAAMESAVRALGFERDAYDFLLAVQSLDDSIPAESIAPKRWYLSAND